MTSLVSPDLCAANQLETITGAAGEPPRWRATGNDPSFDAVLEAPLAGGWYEVVLRVRVVRGRIHAPALYPDYARGYVVEAERQLLPLLDARRGDHVISQLVRLTADVTRLRLDPSVLPCEFEVQAFTLRRMGRAEAARHMFGKVLNARAGMGKVRVIARTIIDLLRGGPRRMADRLFHAYAANGDVNELSDYDVWVEFYDDCSADAIAAALAGMPPIERTPVFSIIVPTYNTDERWLRRCLDSVIAQTYPHWELCIADDASSDPRVWRVIEEYMAADHRIRAVRRQANGHIAAASNSALALASGDFVALLDHDDELHPLALHHCALALERNPSWRMLYTDEDKIDEHGRRSDPYFKADWNPDLFLSQNCVCHLGVYARDLVTAIGGFRQGYDGAQDWDLALRAIEHLRADQIGHVPRVLYHWRMIEGSTALAPTEKDYAHRAAMRAIQDHLDRTRQHARVKELPGYSGYYRIAHQLPRPAPLVSILIPTRDRVDLLRQCIDSITRRTDYPAYEILVIDNGSCERRSLGYLASLASRSDVRVLRDEAPFNYSAINNRAARHARGEVLALLNNDIEVIHPEWLTEMVSHALRPEIGVVGCMLYYPNDTIQHAGTILGIGGVAGHAYVGMPRGYPGDKHRAGLAQNLSAVTAACAVVRRQVFEQVGGLDEDLVVAFNDVDFCLRVREAGYRNLWTPFAELYHHESASRGYENTPEKIQRFKREERFMQDRWGGLLESDPYYNVNLSLTNTPFTLAYPPRRAPWDRGPEARLFSLSRAT